MRRIGQRGHLNIRVVVEHLLVILRLTRADDLKAWRYIIHAERKNIGLRADLHLRIKNLRRYVGGGVWGAPAST